MQKIKLIGITTLALFLISSGVLVRTILASMLAIQTLPSFINTNNFKLSCTSNGGVVQFSVSKHGGAFTDFGPSINTSSEPCIVQVDSSVVNDQTDYVFSAGGKTTSTTYDASGPSPVSGYSKERVSDGEYKLHFHTPNDTDFTQVVIYRGDAVDFSADSGHEIARVSGSPNVDLTYSDHFTPDSNKTYFYSIRALDHAGNSSSLNGDGSTTGSTTVTSASPKATTGKVTTLPKEQGSGSVLGTEAGATPVAGSDSTPASAVANSQNGGILTWVLGHKKISLGVVLILIVIGYLLLKKKNK